MTDPLLCDPTAIQSNRCLMHAPWAAHASLAAAKAGAASPWVQSLDGQWAFHLAPRPDAVPALCETVAFDDRAWARIAVPGNWETQGHGEAIYCNCSYPFAADPPFAPADNPTGSYRTSFELPASWSGRQVFLEFGSVDSGFRCWVNGTEVGFSTDSKLPATFDVTALVRPGSNQLAVRVYRFPTGAYLEKQDYWHLSGIQRSVRLIAKPAVHLRDWCVQTRLDAGFANAVLHAQAWISRPGSAEIGNVGQFRYVCAQGWTVAMTLLDPEGREIASAAPPVGDHSPMYGEAGGRDLALAARAELAVPAVQAWSAETPVLYTLVLELRDPQGKAVDWERVRVGFRQVGIVDGQVRINGRRMVVRGVNRHEFHPRRGRAVTVEDMRADIIGMKRLNFNSVRTCHYPDCEAWYDLCDELGMYLVDEANLETHGIEALASRDPAWAGAYLERAVRMVLRDRNHASVCFWSLGNESYWGPHHAAMANWIRVMDPTRPVQYESGNPPPLVTDIKVPMYPQLDWVRKVMADHSEKRPMIMCEYAYAKGNSTGNVGKFWDLVWEQPRFQGGFVWDWADKALAVDDPAAPGGVRWRYGSKHVEVVGVERMCLNGVVGPDLREHPGAWELKQAQAPVLFWTGPDDLAKGQVWLCNRHQFIGTGHLRVRWEVVEDGRIVATGEVPAPEVAPGASATVGLGLPAAGEAAERFLNLRAVLGTATAWAPAGHELTATQMALPGSPAKPAVAGSTPLSLEEGVASIVLSGQDWRLTVDRTAGAITSLTSVGSELLARPILPCVDRAPTDIDLGLHGNSFAADWKRCGLDRLAWQPGRIEVFRLDAQRALLRIHGCLAATDASARVEVTQEWTVHGSGDLVADVQMQVTAPVTTIPRIGLVTSLVGGDRELAWHGRGPHENYPDRLHSAFVGRHRAKVRDLLGPYIFPQECGLRCDVRWAAITDRTGAGLLVMGQPTLHCSALPVRLEDLRDCRNLADLRLRDEVALHLDGYHMGLGGDTGWTRNVHLEFCLPPGRYRFGLRMRPLRAGEDPERM